MSDSPVIPVDSKGFPTLDGTPWDRIIFGHAGPICGWDKEGVFHQWGETEEIAEAVFRRWGSQDE